MSHSKYSQIALALPLSIVMLSGCVIVPHEPDVIPADSKIEAWIGSSKDEVISKFGSPTYAFEYKNAEYVFYKTTRKETFIGLFPVPVIPGAVPAVFTEEHPYLLVLIFNKAKKLEQSLGGLPRDHPTSDAIKEGLIERAVAGDVEAEQPLLWLFGVKASEIRAAQLRQRAQLGDIAAATALARYFDEREALEMLARTDAQASLALRTLDEARPAQQVPSTGAITDKKDLFVRAQDGDAEAQYQLYWSTVSADAREAHTWLCEAAEYGHPDARYRIGLLYRYGNEGLPQDLAKAYLWYHLAANAGNVSARKVLKALVPKMKPSELSRGESLLETWKPGQCKRTILK